MIDAFRLHDYHQLYSGGVRKRYIMNSDNTIANMRLTLEKQGTISSFLNRCDVVIRLNKNKINHSRTEAFLKIN